MDVNTVSPGSYNSPSIQPQSQIQAQRAPEKTREAKPEETTPPSPERSSATVNTSGQTVGQFVNIKA